MKRASIALGAMALAMCASIPTGASDGRAAEASAPRPNVIVILADDLGYGDIGANGGKRIPTPNIDALAASGARVTNGYVTAAVCAPSRSGLLSGRHQARFGFEFNPVGRDEKEGLPPGETTVAEVMKSAGYATGMVGKWHVGQAPDFHPMDQGFDFFYGVLAGATNYWKAQAPGDVFAATGEDKLITRERLPIYSGRQVVQPDEYLTDVFTEQAVDFIGRNKSKPFFLYVPYTTPHTPLQASKKYADRFPHLTSEYDRSYAALVSSLDDGVGRILAKLDAEGLRRNTVVIFLSDNGCANYIRGACTNGHLSGYKAYPWEGGIRVPYLVSWPGRIRPGAFHQPVSSLDILSTAAAVAGVRAPAQAEGLNLVSYLNGKGPREPRALFWRMGPNHAVRHGKWKLLVVNKSDRVQDIEREVFGQAVPDGIKAEVSALGQWMLLYDLEADPAERNNLASKHPEVVARLERAFADWDRKNVEPMWTSRRQFHSEVNGHRIQLFN